MTPDRPGLWRFRNRNGRQDLIPIVAVEGPPPALEPRHPTIDALSLDDFALLGTWEKWECEIP